MRSARRSFCEWKGSATYWTIQSGSNIRSDAGWSYENPSPSYAALRSHVAFYATRVDEAWVDEERVIAQPGDFYGGWITREIVGPFKGGPGTVGW